MEVHHRCRQCEHELSARLEAIATYSAAEALGFVEPAPTGIVRLADSAATWLPSRRHDEEAGA